MSDGPGDVVPFDVEHEPLDPELGEFVAAAHESLDAYAAARTADEARIDEYVAAARRRVHAAAIRRDDLERHAPAPEDARPARQRAGLIAAACALMAVVVVAIGVLATGGVEPTRQQAVERWNEATRVSADEQERRRWTAHSAEQRTDRERGTSRASKPALEETPVHKTVVDEPEPVPEEALVADEAEPEPEPASTKAPRSPSEVCRELDRQAQERWRAGDIAGAKRAFRKIIRRGKPRKFVELAYSDLFTIARRNEGRAAEEALWREYLQRFPRGRFADDVRASLCRRAKPARRAACWERYLSDMKRGDHRDEARAALPKGER